MNVQAKEKLRMILMIPLLLLLFGVLLSLIISILSEPEVRELALAVILDVMEDTLPDSSVLPERVFPEPAVESYLGAETNSRELVLLFAEVYPFYEREGIIQPGSSVPPSTIGFSYYPGNAYFFVAGRTLCPGPSAVLTLSSRYINPYSPWYRDSSILSSLVHETGHALGICSGDEDVEVAAQVAMIEVLAAMASEGNSYAVKPLVRELKWLLLGHLQAELPPRVYNFFLKTMILTKPKEQILLERIYRGGGREPPREYRARPYRIIRDAVWYSEGSWTTVPLPFSPERKSLIKLDDTTYFLQHLFDYYRLGRSGQ